MHVFLSTAYLAPIEYYSKLISSGVVFIEQHENYVKQSYRNRCTILSANGAMPLSIPVESAGGQKCPIRDIKISDHGNWQHLHWNALISAYNSSPFFEYYRDDFEPFYNKKHKFLFDFNEKLFYTICELLDVDTQHIQYTESYATNLSDTDKDFRQILCPKKDWLDVDPHFASVPYYQVFDQKFGFSPNLSIVDLLFNMGNESILILNKSITDAGQ